jgi:hypothetical protein
LLDYLNNEARFDSNQVPPYIVASEHVEKAFRKNDLRDLIRNRFLITLDLDPRYKIIALVIALKTLEFREQPQTTENGFSVEWIRNEALGWWGEKGFQDRSFEAFRTLLDEMIGLGVLRRTGKNQTAYALRSPTIVNLLGTRDEIEQNLLDATEAEPPPTYEAATFRRAESTANPWQRGPLTGEQESKIFTRHNGSGVSIVFGTHLAGLSDVVPFIQLAANSLSDITVTPITENVIDLNAFRLGVEKFLKNGSNKVEVLLVPHTLPWSENWVETAIELITRKRGYKTGTWRVLFVGDTHAAWRWRTLPNVQDGESQDLVDIHTLHNWASDAFRHWVKDTGIGPCTDQEVQNCYKITRGWGPLIHALGERIKENPAQWRESVKAFEREVVSLGSKLLMQDVVKEALPVLDVMRSYAEPINLEELVGLTEISVPDVERIIHWCELIGLITPDAHAHWRLESAVSDFINGIL